MKVEMNRVAIEAMGMTKDPITPVEIRDDNGGVATAAVTSTCSCHNHREASPPVPRIMQGTDVFRFQVRRIVVWVQWACC